MKDKLFSLRNLYRRFIGEMPSFFKKLMVLLLSLGSIGLFIEGFKHARPTTVFPAWIDAISSYLAVAGLFGALIAKMTVKDNSQARPS